MKATILAAIAVMVWAGVAEASAIRKACMSGVRAGSPGLCSCIQAAADRTLTKRDQKLAAKFFKDPDRAQEIRQSKRRQHEVFWDRYKNFGAYAEAYCS